MGIPFDASRVWISFGVIRVGPLDALLLLDDRGHLKIAAKDHIPSDRSPSTMALNGCGSFNGDRIHRVRAMKHPVKKPGSQNADAKQQGGRYKFEDRSGAIARSVKN